MNESMTAETFSAFAANGPWAAMAGLLLWQVLKAWSSDREQVTKLLGEFKNTLEAMTKTMEHIAEELKEIKGAKL
jgi:hypothetical protein